MNLQIRALEKSDQRWVSEFIKEHWGSSQVIAHHMIYEPARLPGFVAIENNAIVGLVTYQIIKDECEIITLNSIQSGQGVGSALIGVVKKTAQEANCYRLWLITTNDNLTALRFYQKRGFALVAIHPNAVQIARKLKPSIPLIGMDGIPLRDELELEMIL